MTGASAAFFAERRLDPAERDAILEKDGVEIRDSEHLHYYRIFQSVFSLEDETMEIPGCPRYGSDPCRACGWQLEAPTQDFCVICGAYPARNR